MDKEQKDINLEKIRQKLAEQTDKSLVASFTIIDGELVDVEFLPASVTIINGELVDTKFLPSPVSSSESEVKVESPKQ
jgi:hypothetical protein